MEAFVKLDVDVSPDQQRDERTDCGLVELGCHPVQALVHRLRIQLFVELLVNGVNDIVQVRVDRGLILAGIRHR